MKISQSYAWQRHCEVAIRETDHARLPTLLADALAAINARMAEIRSSRHVTPAELKAIEDAESSLLVLIKETTLREKAG